MKRWLLLAAGLVLLAAGLHVAGRAPSPYVLEKECARHLAERRDRWQRMQMAIARAEQARRQGAEVALEPLLAEREELLRAHEELRIRGWEVLLIPAGADRPPPADYLVALRHDPSGPDDPGELRGATEVWIAPRGGLARLLSDLGLTP